MKIFTKKGILQKIIVSIMIMLSFNFITPAYSRADVGGILISPIVDLVATLGDVVINLLQRAMTGDWGAGARFSTNPFMVNSDEYFSNKSKYEGDLEEGDVVTDGGTVYPDASKEDGGFDKGWMNHTMKYQIPVATYSPEQIFAGNVAGLDINFISPNNERFGYDEVFGRSAVMNVVDLKQSGASKLLSNLVQKDIIEPVSGYGKGKYKFN